MGFDLDECIQKLLKKQLLGEALLKGASFSPPQLPGA